MTEFNPFRTVQDLFDAAAEQLGLDRSARELLRWPMREFRALIPVHMDDGFIRVFHAHRVQYNYAMGPTIGGLRWHPDASVDPSRAAAAFTSWQTAVLQLPLAGASGGIDCNPKELSGGEKERLARGFVRAFQGVIGADRDIIVPDIYTTPQVMGWMLDAFERGAGHREPGVVAGKPVAVGGMPGHGEATARGAVILVREAASELDLDPKNLTFAIHGFGNLGRGIASQHLKILGGGRLVAVSDSRGGIRKESGLEPGSLNMHKIQTGRVTGMPDSEEITPDEVLALDVDVIYASAPPGRITVEHAKETRARIVCEVGEACIAPETHAALHDAQTLVIPDMLATGGRLTGAHLEVVQNSDGDRWPVVDFNRRLDERMVDAWREVRDMALGEGAQMRMATWMVGISRLAEACRARGWC